MKPVRLVTVTENQDGQRIDNYLFRIFKGVPKSHVYRILRSGEVRVNKKRIDQTYRLQAGDIIRIPPVKTAEREEKRIPDARFDILYEDDSILVINKPAGVAVHGGSGVSFGVIEQLRAMRPEAKFLELVHRLDKETSGILVLAKKRSALTRLHEQIREGAIDKRYQALVHGNWKNQRQHVRLPLLKYHTADGERRVRVDAAGQASHTVFNVLRHYPDFTLLEAELKTGRTHQIRVHLASSGFVIAGDEKYGDYELNRQLQKGKKGEDALKRMFLHACKITFVHPETGKPVTITAPLPDECAGYLKTLESGNSKTLKNLR
ncbi:23S rRNA pseudouridine(955/2504/2580) synthase RluC [Oxalobacter aliiformigenes]|uniref:Pseudouridine synthase n=2 Tax=Oxalobacter aliiformigenes TaxID=2946593 RepID=A0A9E9LDN8_9BURK|nr:23S rRNA pseudouridine(955/2504/2580) synthase RluC [Oxalobacter aliiformigenes]WAV92208.1 23S rRNA pseudouridine(955/2504/2580) synthase RluC [Oxalobacter aliiformigenes]